MPSGSESQEGSGHRRPTRRQAAWARAGELFSRLETASGGSIAGHEVHVYSSNALSLSLSL